MIRDFISLCTVAYFIAIFTLWASVATSKPPVEPRYVAQTEIAQ